MNDINKDMRFSCGVGVNWIVFGKNTEFLYNLAHSNKFSDDVFRVQLHLNK
jgi:hypothetical protein